MNRVVITGVGLRTALGNTPSALHQALLEGRSAVRAMPAWDVDGSLRSLVAAPIMDFDAGFIPRKARRTMGRVAALAACAAQDAVLQAGLSATLLESGRVGLAIGSTTGSTQALHDFWGAYLGVTDGGVFVPGDFFKVMSHTAVANTAMLLGITGECHAPSAACASGAQAIGLALARLRAGMDDVMVAGGADELHRAVTVTFDGLMGASRGYNDDPQATPRPFDAARDGIVVGEGAGVVAFETLSSALARGATILAEVLGYAGTTDAGNMASPGTEGMERAVRLALQDAGVAAAEIDFVNAHATGTPLGDAAEAQALYAVFGADTPVSSWKGHLGHTLAACGAIEVVALMEVMRTGRIPPTRNLVHADVSPLWLPAAPVDREVRTVLSTNFAFGGANTALVLRRWPAPSVALPRLPQ